MDQTSGRPEVVIGLIDGPVALSHPDLSEAKLSETPGHTGTCLNASSAACAHGTFVAGVLTGRRGSPAPAVCPDCTLIVRPIFSESGGATDALPPKATKRDLAAAIVETVDAGARILNLSVELADSSRRDDDEVRHAIEYATNRSAAIVVAVGNHGTVGGSFLSKHASILPVAACDHTGRPTHTSNLGRLIARCGVAAPGESVISLGTEDAT
jgi:subtilisin family serine protease